MDCYRFRIVDSKQNANLGTVPKFCEKEYTLLVLYNSNLLTPRLAIAIVYIRIVCHKKKGVKFVNVSSLNTTLSNKTLHLHLDECSSRSCSSVVIHGLILTTPDQHKHKDNKTTFLFYNLIMSRL